MSDPILSLCIPTYNFGKFIGETLGSILPQVTPKTEVVILDSGSTDETPSIVQNYARHCPNLRYHRRDCKKGIDRDVAFLVSLAKGKYIWLFSSDDVVKPRAIELIFEELAVSNEDVYLGNFTICGLNIEETYWEHPIFKTKETKTFDLAQRSERLAFFRTAITTTAFFSFIGNLIIKKKRWDETPCPEKFYGSCWAHAARIFNMIPHGLKVKYLSHSLLRKRGFNDSFLDRGIVNRFAIAIDGYHEIGNTFFGKTSEEAFHIRRAVQYEHPLKAVLISAKSQVNSKEEEKQLDALVEKLYQDPSWFNALRKWIYTLLPPKFLRILKFIYQRRSFFKHFRTAKLSNLFLKKRG